ncbi:Uncharacterised protein [uncultured archaeon]|nr:Uncharacterised protein [uncultured archaeon]
MGKFGLLNLCLSIMKEAGESFRVGVTLFVGGTIISGDLIHPRAYYRATLGMLDTLVEEPNSKIASNFIEELIKESIEESKSAKQSSNKNQEGEQDEIHLNNIKIMYMSVPIVYNNAFVAIRVDAIDGFVLGKVSKDT